MRRLILFAALLLTAAAAAPTAAHPGGLAADGCHNNRRTGERHCHGGSRPAADGPDRSTRPSGGSFGLTGPTSAPRGGGAFANCSAAREAGAAPVRRGQPGYGPHLDGDGDGIGCER